MDSKYLLALDCIPEIGGQTIKKLLAFFNNDAEKLWKVNLSVLEDKIGKKNIDIITKARDQIDPLKQVEKLQKLNIGYLTIFDKNYPKLLAQAYDAPVILYIKGNISILSSPSLAVVGSRKYTRYGAKVAYDLSKKCAQSGLTIVSGLALGVDAIAHRATIDCGGKTVGVLGCGLDRIYPVSNFQLGKEIIEKGGAVVSEFPPGTPPLRHHFPQRNRIIAGLCAGVLVVEAAEKSGALITAYQALEYSREVFSVPGNIDSLASFGTNKLIQNGAKAVMEASDILSELNIEEKIVEEKSRKEFIQSEEEKIIEEILSDGDKLVDEIVLKSGLNVIAINTALTMMEMKGVVENVGGGRYKLR